MASNDKKQAWRMLIYPDSVHENWQSELNQRGLIWCASPIHDKDELKTGGFVKPHRHLIVVWPGPTTRNNAEIVAIEIGAVSRILTCDFPLNAYKYFTHDENSDKVKYRLEDGLCSESFTVKLLEDLRDEEEDEIIALIKVVIKTVKPATYYDLDCYLENMAGEDIRLWRYCRKHTLYIRELVKGATQGRVAAMKKLDKDQFVADFQASFNQGK